jgi:hypothetical protein
LGVDKNYNSRIKEQEEINTFITQNKSSGQLVEIEEQRGGQVENSGDFADSMRQRSRISYIEKIYLKKKSKKKSLEAVPSSKPKYSCLGSLSNYVAQSYSRSSAHSKISSQNDIRKKINNSKIKEKVKKNRSLTPSIQCQPLASDLTNIYSSRENIRFAVKKVWKTHITPVNSDKEFCKIPNTVKHKLQNNSNLHTKPSFSTTKHQENGKISKFSLHLKKPLSTNTRSTKNHINYSINKNFGFHPIIPSRSKVFPNSAKSSLKSANSSRIRSTSASSHETVQTAPLTTNNSPINRIPVQRVLCLQLLHLFYLDETNLFE